MKTFLRCVVLVLTLCNFGQAEAQQSSKLDKLRFLIGDWEGAEGIWSIGPERFSFAFDLKNTVIVMKSHMDHPSVAGRPPYSVEALMIIYVDPATNKLRADSFSDGGSVLHYIEDTSSRSPGVTFISEMDYIGHRFKFTFFERQDGALGMRVLMSERGRTEFADMNEGAAYKK